MKKVAYLFDSSSSYRNDIPEKDIYVLPINIHYKVDNIMKSFAENINISQDEINKILLENKDISTSLVNPEVVKDRVLELLKEYDQVFYVPISNSISSTYEKALPVMKEINEKYGHDKFLVIKSNAVSYLARMVMDRFIELYNGNNFEEAQKTITDDIESDRYFGMLFVNNLTQLIKGGRIKKIKGAIAKLMNFKLLVSMRQNLDFYDKALTYSSQINKTIELFNQSSKRNNSKISEIVIVYDGLEETKRKYIDELNLIDTLKKNLNVIDNVKITETYMPGVIKIHTGLNSLSIIIKLEI